GSTLTVRKSGKDGMGYHWSQLHANRIPRWRVILVPASAVSIGFWQDRICVGARCSERKAVGKSPYSLRITTIRPEESLPHERSECPGCRAPTEEPEHTAVAN